jgi:hypothetical protein
VQLFANRPGPEPAEAQVLPGAGDRQRLGLVLDAEDAEDQIDRLETRTLFGAAFHGRAAVDFHHAVDVDLRSLAPPRASVIRSP